MRRALIFAVYLLLLGAHDACVAAATHNCTKPPRPTVPDGESATENELLNARTRLEQFLKDANLYLTCIKSFEDQLAEAQDEVDGHALVVDYNTMVEEMYLAGDEFNIALRRYRLIHGEDEE